MAVVTSTPSRGEVFATELSNNYVQVLGSRRGVSASLQEAGIQVRQGYKYSRITYVGNGTGRISIFEIRDQEAKAFGSYGTEVCQLNAIRCTAHIAIDREGRLHGGELVTNRKTIMYCKIFL